jgi:hypothetical protein
LRRTLSGPIFTAKMGAGGCFGFFGGAQLGEPGMAQAAVAAEDVAVPAEDRPRGQGRKLIASVRFMERPMRHAEPAEPLHALKQMTQVGCAADDQMGMGQVLREEEACNLDGGVTGLDDLMGMRKVGPDEEVDIRRVVALVVAHGTLL